MRRLASACSLALLGACATPGGSQDDATTETTAASTESGPGTDSETGVDTDEPGSDLPGAEPNDCDRLLELLDALASAPDPDALIAAFVREVGYGERGFPIAEADKLAVVHVGEPGQALSVAGDFNAWDAAAHPLSEAAPGFYYAIVQLDAPPSGLYKLVRDDAEYFADPLARRFGWDQFGEYSQVDALPDRGHHERWLEFDQAVGELALRTLTVYVPIAAGDGDALPVLYMHDGQNLFAPDALWGGWQVSATVEQAIADAVLEPLIIVGIDNTPARFDEYTQVEDVIDGTVYGGRADEYAAFLVDGIKPFVESRYPAASAPADVGVMGSSLGGLVSLYIGLHYADTFSNVASMSGTVDWGTFGASNPTILDDFAVAPPLGLRIYLDSGGDPGFGCPDDGSDNYCGNVEFADALRDWGWVDEVDLFYRWEPGAPHNEAAWAERVLPAIVDWF